MESEEKIIAEIKKAIDEKGYTTHDDVVKAVNEVIKNHKSDEVAAAQKQIEELLEIAKRQGEELVSIKSHFNDGKTETLRDVLVKAVEDIKTATANKTSARVILKTAVLRSAITSDVPGMNLPDIGRPATARLRMAELCSNWPVSADSHGTIGFWDQTTTTRNAANRAENAAAPESAIGWTYVSKTIDKIFDSIPFTKEVAMDITWLQAEIENFINTNIAIKENNQILLGTGTSPELYGLFTNATEFDFATFGQTIEKASFYDLIRAMQTTIQSGKDNNFICNYAVVNDLDLLRMTSEKDANGQYVVPPFVKINPDGTVNIGGVLVVPQSDMTENTCLVGDFTKARRYNMDGIELEIGYVGDDFKYDRQTLLGRVRESIVVRNVDTGAFLKCSNMTNAMAGITTPTA